VGQVITPNPQAPQLINPTGSISQAQPVVSVISPINVSAVAPKKRINKKVLIIVIVALVLIIGGSVLAHSMLEKKSSSANKNSASSFTNSASFACNNVPSGSTVKSNYTSSSGGYSVWFPYAPNTVNQQGIDQIDLPDGTQLGSGITTSYDTNTSSGIPQYEVDVFAMPSGDSFTASQIADYSVKSTLLIPGSKVICSSPSKIEGVSAETFAMYTPASSSNDSPNTYTYSIIAVNHNSIYSIGMATTQQNDPNATKFLNSFSFNN
jgi:hypothetical protein